MCFYNLLLCFGCVLGVFLCFASLKDPQGHIFWAWNDATHRRSRGESELCQLCVASQARPLARRRNDTFGQKKSLSMHKLIDVTQETHCRTLLKPVWIIWSLLEVALIYRASFAAASCGRPLSADFKRGRNGIANPGGYQIDSSSKKWYISTVNQIETSSRWSILKPVHRNEAAGEPSEWCPVHKVKVVPGVKQSLHGFQMFSQFSRFLTFWNGFADILGSSWIK